MVCDSITERFFRVPVPRTKHSERLFFRSINNVLGVKPQLKLIELKKRAKTKFYYKNFFAEALVNLAVIVNSFKND